MKAILKGLAIVYAPLLALYCLVILLFFMIVGCGTVAQKPVPPVAPPPGVSYFVPGPNGKTAFTKDGRPILTPLGVIRYNALVAKYGHEAAIIPPLNRGDGLTPFTNGTALLERVDYPNWALMDAWQRKGRASP
jgi:hypothetical protein